ncbi:MAG: DEAD/DEAH box helicase [Clostridiales bacterium]|nr:DEAD/DEAH box helicase [Clostridiales bacterium]
MVKFTAADAQIVRRPGEVTERVTEQELKVIELLPSILAKQLEQGIGDYIETTFPMTNEPFKGSIQKMLEQKGSVYHEPYIAVRLPFRVVGTMPTCFEAIHPAYLPYVHQQKAFDRLVGDDGRSTLVATGTGSGKTECFLYPILEYCYQHKGERGIKALIIYPMNALATDQSKRIAELIYESKEMRGNISVGMYVGGQEKAPARMMSEHGVITDHETMLNNLPDILMTNYKMVDYLLVRPKDAMLWQDNGPETLKYIAVDELHTFDGAQGTDLACLPIFMNHADVPMQRRRKEWDEEIDGFITYEEEHNEKYQYSRRNFWRLQYKDERSDPRRYHSEEEYLTAREEQQNRWKSRYRNTNLYGLDIDQYVDETEFLSAYRLARQAHLEEEKEEQYSAEAKAKKEIAEKLLGGTGDIAIYEYCQILLPSSNTAYSYLTGGISLEIGDRVIVPVGSGNREVVGIVVSVEKHTEMTAPYPVAKTKRILKKETDFNMVEKKYNFYGWETANVKPVSAEYSVISSPTMLYDILSEIWSADTCAPRLREEWSEENKTLGQCSITAFLAQDIFGGKVYGILRPGGNYHCYNVVGDCCFDLTSEQFGEEAKDLVYENNPEQNREKHFAKEEKRHRYELLKSQLKKWCNQK